MLLFELVAHIFTNTLACRISSAGCAADHSSINCDDDNDEGELSWLRMADISDDMCAGVCVCVFVDTSVCIRLCEGREG